MIGTEELIDVLASRIRGLRDRVRARRREVLEGLKPRNILDAEDLKKVRAVLESLQLPRPSRWVEALQISSIRSDKEGFSADRVYCSRCLKSLVKTLRGVGLDEAILTKLEEAAELSKRYKISRCIFPRGEHGIAP